jgi:hypothetical protein
MSAQYLVPLRDAAASPIRVARDFSRFALCRKRQLFKPPRFSSNVLVPIKRRRYTHPRKLRPPSPDCYADARGASILFGGKSGVG